MLGIALLLVGALLLVWHLRSVFRYLFFALVILYIVNPFVKYLRNMGFRKNLAYVFVICTFMLAILGSVYFAGPKMVSELSQVQKDWPRIEQRIDEQVLRKVSSPDGGVISYYVPIIKAEIKAGTLKIWFDIFAKEMKSAVGAFLPVVLSSLILVPIFTILIIKDRKKIWRSFFGFVPNRYFEVVMSMAYEVNRAIENFVSAKVVQSLIVGGVCSVGFLLTGVKFPLVLGFFAGLMNIVPYLGPIIGGAPPVVISYLLLDSRTAVLALVIVILAQLVDNLFTQPVLIPKLMKEHPLVVVLVTLTGAKLFGAIGLVLGLVIFSVMKIILVKSYMALDVIHSRQEQDKASNQITLNYY
ncbi:TPA: AI-2E family transporter [Candidatus Woesearchaeota archaeon]|nr:AI-2E family transporter [Candidatus Woesearchaeota archaeon]